MRFKQYMRSKKRTPKFLSLVLALTAGVAFAQQGINVPSRSGTGNAEYDRTKAVPTEKSRAQQEADQLVALSADKIISLLTDEPGLFLECKKILVRTAFNQGRVLEEEDLTDDNVFRMVREDHNVRVLFTREIEDRYYVRAKPRKEDLDRDWEQGRIRVPDATELTAEGQTTNDKNAKNEEDAYWLRHERDLDRTKLPGANNIPNPPQAPQQSPLPFDPRQQLEMTKAAADEGDYDYPPAGGLGGFGNPSLGTDQASSLLMARMGGAGGSGGNDTSPLSKGLDESGLMGSGTGSTGLDGFSMGPFTGFSGGDLSSATAAGSFEQYQYPTALNGSSAVPFAYRNYPRRLDFRDKQPALRRRANPYADVPSLYDLYAQYPRRNPRLDRFGIDIFENGTGNFDALPIDMPVGPDYVLGPGDNLNINLFGGISQRLHRVVDREGKIALPEAGAVQVSGRSLGDVQRIVQSTLRTEYRDIQADVSLGRLRTVRVYVVGDVQRPGAYQVSSLSTPLNAVYEAGGPTSRGSLRILNHYRGKQLVQKIDVYDLLLHGVSADMQPLQAGDTVQVPPLGPEVTIQGMVRRPAIYELNGEKSLAEVLQLAGGVLPTGTLRHVDLERLESHESRTMLRLDIPENNNQESVTQTLDNFLIQDGDKVQISPILPYAEKTVFLDGYVFSPGKFAYRDGMKVTDLVKSYKDLLPEPYKQHAEIIRLKVPDNTPEVLAFNLDDALAGKDQDIVLQPFDTVRIFGRYDFEDPPIVTVTGEVRDPGDHITNGAIHLRDAVFMAGNTTVDAQLTDAQVFRKTTDGKLEVISANLSAALSGDPKENILLEPKDRVFIHRDLNKLDPPMVTIQGEVARPGKYPLGENMSAADLVKTAGGFKRGAYMEQADLTRYEVSQGSKVVSDHVSVPIAKAMLGEADADVRLRDGDVLNIGAISGWQDLGATIQVKGEVAHPGGYGIQPGEHLSSVIARAGGFLPTAYPYGAIFTRVELREIEEKNRADLIQRIRAEQQDVKIVPEMDADDQAQAKATVLQYRKTIEKLANTPPAGRLVIHISSDPKRWAGTSTDIQLRAGDVIYIPKRPSTVIIDGSVYNPTGVTYKPGKNTGWYLRQAGGPTSMADRKATFVVRADGSVAGGSGGILGGNVESTELRPGDMVVVPEKIYVFNNKFKSTLAVGQIASAIGSAIAISAYYATH